MRKVCSTVIFVMLMVVMAISIFKIGAYYLRYVENEAMYREVKEAVIETGKELPEKKNLEVLSKVYDNPDRIGWIEIPSTKIDYPMMQSVGRENFYLHHDYYGNAAAHGCPYLQEDCRVDESDNLILYGHHMKDGTMFADLDGYISREFWESHRRILFIVGDEKQQYEVFCVFKTSASGGFPYTTFTKAAGEQDFNAFIRACRKLSFYDTGISAAYGDRLLTLSTCEYTLENGRLVVVAKKI